MAEILPSEALLRRAQRKRSSCIGAREYYREQLGYRRDGPYMTKRL